MDNVDLNRLIKKCGWDNKFFNIFEKKVISNNSFAPRYSEQRIGQFAVLYKLHNYTIDFEIKPHAFGQ